MLYPLPVKKMTEALTWDQGNTRSLVHGDVGVTDKVGYSPMRAQKQMCSCCSVVCQSNHSTLMVSVVCVDCAPFLYSTGGKYPSLTSYFNTSFNSLGLVMLTQPFQTPEVMVRDQKRAGLGMVALWSGCD